MRQMREEDRPQDKAVVQHNSIAEKEASQEGTSVKLTHTARNNAVPEVSPFWKEIFQPAVPDVNGLESTRFLARWLFFGCMIGVVSGIGAIALSLAISIATKVFLNNIVGYFPPGTSGEGITKWTPIAHLWLLPLIVAIGGLLSGLLVFIFAPDAEGHGTDAVIDAVHHGEGKIKARVPIVKLIASAITIGSGGSSGREGPVVQIGAGLSSMLGNLFHLSPEDRRIAVTIGMGAGIGAVFKAPFGGALFAAEILYLHDVEFKVFVPAIIASTISYTVYSFFFGFTPIFGNLHILDVQSPIQLVYYAVIGVCAGFAGICYASSFYGVNRFFHHLRLPDWTKPAFGGVIVGLIGLAFPQVLGMSYGWVELLMNSKFLLTIPLWVLLCLPLAKILATGLSIGSGGSGGTYGPAMVIGGFLGAFLWDIMHTLPFMPQQPAIFIIVGMMALCGAVAHTPIAVLVMVAEMTGSLSLLAPAMIALAISITIVGNNTIFRSQILNRMHAPPHKRV
jgi:CIC family chloride channel protein